MKKATFLLASAALSLSLAGCTATVTTNTSSSNTNTAKPAAPAAPATPAPSANTNAATPAAESSGDLSNLTVSNKTEWAVHHLYLSPAKENEWGQDQLGKQTIEPGSSFKLSGIPCNTYDIKVVDEGGDECIISGEKFCGHEATWNLTQDELLSCEGYGEK